MPDPKAVELRQKFLDKLFDLVQTVDSTAYQELNREAVREVWMQANRVSGLAFDLEWYLRTGRDPNVTVVQ